jgi:hypothetical protein
MRNEEKTRCEKKKEKKRLKFEKKKKEKSSLEQFKRKLADVYFLSSRAKKID